jgi:hypothetical protein
LLFVVCCLLFVVCCLLFVVFVFVFVLHLSSIGNRKSLFMNIKPKYTTRKFEDTNGSRVNSVWTPPATHRSSKSKKKTVLAYFFLRFRHHVKIPVSCIFRLVQAW